MPGTRARKILKRFPQSRLKVLFEETIIIVITIHCLIFSFLLEYLINWLSFMFRDSRLWRCSVRVQ